MLEVGVWDVGLAIVNLLQTCFLAYLAFRARPSGPLEAQQPADRALTYYRASGSDLERERGD